MISGGNEAARLYVSVKADIDSAMKGMAAIDRSVRDVGETVKRTNPLLEGIGQGFGISLTNLAADAGRALVDYAGDSIQAASDMAESQSKVDTVFGRSAASISKFADSAAEDLGLSKQAALEAAGTFGNLFGTMGLGASEAAAMSKEIVALGADLASFNNIDPTTALEKLRSGLTGESEPLKSLGVLLTETNVKAKAMAMGLDDASGELSEAAKVQARYALILEQTAVAQGDVARTGGEAAGQARELAARAADLSAQFGEVLIPAVMEFQKTIIYALDRTAIPLEELEEAARRGSQGAQAQLRGLEHVAQEMGVSLEQAFEAYRETGSLSIDAIRSHLAALDAEGSLSLQSVGQAASEAAGHFDDIAGGAGSASDAVELSAADMVAAMADVADRAQAEAKRVIDDYYGPLERAAELAAIKRQISEQEQVAASQESTAAQVADAKARVTELQHAQMDLIADLGIFGELTSKDLSDAIATLREDWETAGAAARADIDATIRQLALLRLAALEAAGALDFSDTAGGVNADHVSGPGYSGHRARGGPVRRDELYLVGEEGPEPFVPWTNGTILPNDSLASGDRHQLHVPEMAASSTYGPTGGGSGGELNLNVNVTVDGSAVFDPYGVAAQYIAQALMPGIQRELARQGVSLG